MVRAASALPLCNGLARTGRAQRIAPFEAEGDPQPARPPQSATVKLWLTAGAPRYSPLPACVAWMVHFPAAVGVAVVPETVQTDRVMEAKLTVSPELEIAVRCSGVPTIWLAMGPKVMVWLAWPTPKVWFAAGAAKYSPLPA